MIVEGIQEQPEFNTKRPKLENHSSAGSLGGGAGISHVASGKGGGVSTAPSSTKSVGTGSGTSSAYSPPHKKSTPPSQAHRAFPSINTGSPSPSKSASAMAADFAGYRDSVTRATQQQQKDVLPSVDTESHFFPRIHTTTQSPHIQQQSSYLRHQPPLMSPQSIGPRSGILPSPTGIRRNEGFSPLSTSGTLGSSSGSSSAPSPSVSGLDDAARIHRALPLPSSSSGYFDHSHRHHQRQPSQSSQPQSPRSAYGQKPPPFQSPSDHHSRSYTSSVPPQHSPSLPGMSGGLPPPPPTPRPPSHHHPG